MYPMFRKTVEALIKKYGNMSLEQFYRLQSKIIKIKKDGYLDFVIEKAGSMLYVGYYRQENGDLISDPIFVFEIRERKWHPIRLEQVFGDTPIGMFEHGRYFYYPGRFQDVKSFATLCSKEWRQYYL